MHKCLCLFNEMPGPGCPESACHKPRINPGNILEIEGGKRSRRKNPCPSGRDENQDPTRLTFR